MRQRKVVLTGGSGFIMSHVAERYAETGDDVVLFDNNQQHDLYEETRDLLRKKKNVAFIRGDIRDAKAVAEIALFDKSSGRLLNPQE